METYLTVLEVAETVKLSVQTIRRYVLNKEIPFHKINRMVRFKPSEIEKWVENRMAVSDVEKSGNLESGLFDKGEV